MSRTTMECIDLTEDERPTATMSIPKSRPIGVEYTVDMVDMLKEDDEFDSSDNHNPLIPLNLYPFRSEDSVDIVITTENNSRDGESSALLNRKGGASRKRTISNDISVVGDWSSSSKKLCSSNAHLNRTEKRIVTYDGSASRRSKCKGGSAPSNLQGVIELDLDDDDDTLDNGRLLASSVDYGSKSLAQNMVVLKEETIIMGTVASFCKQSIKGRSNRSQLGIVHRDTGLQAAKNRAKYKRLRKRRRDNKNDTICKVENQQSGQFSEKKVCGVAKVMNTDANGRTPGACREIIELSSDDESDLLQSGKLSPGEIAMAAVPKDGTKTSDQIKTGAALLKARSSKFDIGSIQVCEGSVKANTFGRSAMIESGRVPSRDVITQRMRATVEANHGSIASKSSQRSPKMGTKRTRFDTGLADLTVSQSLTSQKVIEVASDDEALVLRRAHIPIRDTRLHSSLQAYESPSRLDGEDRVASLRDGFDDKKANLHQDNEEKVNCKLVNCAITTSRSDRMRTLDLRASKSSMGTTQSDDIANTESKNVTKTPREKVDSLLPNVVEVAVVNEVELSHIGRHGFASNIELKRQQAEISLRELHRLAIHSGLPGEDLAKGNSSRAEVLASPKPIGVEHTVDILDMDNEDDEIASREDHDLLIPLHLYPFRSEKRGNFNPRAICAGGGDSETNVKGKSNINGTVLEASVDEMHIKGKPPIHNMVTSGRICWGGPRSTEGFPVAAQQVIELESDEEGSLERNIFDCCLVDRRSKGSRGDNDTVSRQRGEIGGVANEICGKRDEVSRLEIPRNMNLLAQTVDGKRRKQKRDRHDKNEVFNESDNQPNMATDQRDCSKNNVDEECDHNNLTGNPRKATSSAHAVIEIASEDESDVLQSKIVDPEMILDGSENLANGEASVIEQTSKNGEAGVVFFGESRWGSVVSNISKGQICKRALEVDGMSHTMIVTKPHSAPTIATSSPPRAISTKAETAEPALIIISSVRALPPATVDVIPDYEVDGIKHHATLSHSTQIVGRDAVPNSSNQPETKNSPQRKGDTWQIKHPTAECMTGLSRAASLASRWTQRQTISANTATIGIVKSGADRCDTGSQNVVSRSNIAGDLISLKAVLHENINIFDTNRQRLIAHTEEDQGPGIEAQVATLKLEISAGDQIGREVSSQTGILPRPRPIGVEYTVDVLDMATAEDVLASSADHDLLIPLHLYPFRSENPSDFNPRAVNAETNGGRKIDAKCISSKSHQASSTNDAHSKNRVVNGGHSWEESICRGRSSPTTQPVIEMELCQDSTLATQRFTASSAVSNSRSSWGDLSVVKKEGNRIGKCFLNGIHSGKLGGLCALGVRGKANEHFKNRRGRKRKRIRNIKNHDTGTIVSVDTKAQQNKAEGMQTDTKNTEIKRMQGVAKPSAYATVEIASDGEGDILLSTLRLPRKNLAISTVTKKTLYWRSEGGKMSLTRTVPIRKRSPCYGKADTDVFDMSKERGAANAKLTGASEGNQTLSRGNIPLATTMSHGRGPPKLKSKSNLPIPMIKKAVCNTGVIWPKPKAGKNKVLVSLQELSLSRRGTDKFSIISSRSMIAGKKNRHLNKRPNSNSEQKSSPHGRKGTIRGDQTKPDANEGIIRSPMPNDTNVDIVKPRHSITESSDTTTELVSDNENDDYLLSTLRLPGKKFIDLVWEGSTKKSNVQSLEDGVISARLVPLTEAVSEDSNGNCSRSCKCTGEAINDSLDAIARSFLVAKPKSEPAKLKSSAMNQPVKRFRPIKAKSKSNGRVAASEVTGARSGGNAGLLDIYQVPPSAVSCAVDAKSVEQKSKFREDGNKSLGIGENSGTKKVPLFAQEQGGEKPTPANAPVLAANPQSNNATTFNLSNVKVRDGVSKQESKKRGSPKVACVLEETDCGAKHKTAEVFLDGVVDLSRSESPSFDRVLEIKNALDPSREGWNGVVTEDSFVEGLVKRGKPCRRDGSRSIDPDSMIKPLRSAPKVFDVLSDDDDDLKIMGGKLKPMFSQPNFILIDMTSDDEMIMSSHAPRVAAPRKPSAPRYYWTGDRSLPTYRSRRVQQPHFERPRQAYRNYVERPRHGHQHFFEREKDFSFAKTRQEALEEQERLFALAAAAMHQHQEFIESMEMQRTNSLGCPIFTRVVELTKLNNTHWKWPCPYARLGLPVDSSAAIIKKQYRKHALRYHPDKCRLDDASLRFQAVTEAYNKIKRED